MRHYVAYHKVREWGEYSVEADDTEFAHYSRHLRAKLEKTIGQTMWAVSGERINGVQVYKLCSVYQITHLEKAAIEDEAGEIKDDVDGYWVVGEGFGFLPQVVLNDYPWFADLMREQGKFSFGINQIRNSDVIHGLEHIRGRFGLENPATKPGFASFQPRKFREGTNTQITANVYERNTQARAACLSHYGYSCVICGFNFEKQYGDMGAAYIHVHHLKPLATIGSEYEIDPIRDLRPVCPNCHAMIHKREPPYTIEEMKQIVKCHCDE